MHILQNTKGLCSRIIEKTAASKWKHTLNTLSNASKGRLLRYGVIVDPARELTGINKGTDNIIRSTGFSKVRVTDPKRKNDVLLSTGGYVTIPHISTNPFISTPTHTGSAHNGTIQYVPADAAGIIGRVVLKNAKAPKSYSWRKPTSNDWKDALALRHEALEATEFRKAFKKYNIDKAKHMANPRTPEPTITLGYSPYKEHNIITRSIPGMPDIGIPHGMHFSPRVLANETRVLGLLQNSGVGDILRSTRKATGESRLMARKAGADDPNSLYKLPITKRLIKQLSKVSPNAKVTPLNTHDMSKFDYLRHPIKGRVYWESIDAPK